MSHHDIDMDADADADADADIHLGGGEEEGARLSTLPLPQTPRIIFHLGKDFNQILSWEHFSD